MQTLTIVPNLDELEDSRLRLSLRFKRMIGTFSFQRRMETLHGGVIVTMGWMNESERSDTINLKSLIDYS